MKPLTALSENYARLRPAGVSRVAEASRIARLRTDLDTAQTELAKAQGQVADFRLSLASLADALVAMQAEAARRPQFDDQLVAWITAHVGEAEAFEAVRYCVDRAWPNGEAT